MSLSPRAKAPPRTGIEARRERQRQEARRAILDATRALLTESEVGDFSIRRLAEKCGYSAPTIYHHFGDKDGLLCALLDDGMRGLAGELDAASAGPDALHRLRATLLTLIHYTTEHRSFAGLWGNLARQPGGAMPASYEAVKAHLDTPLDELIASGRLEGFDRASAEQVLWALLHGLIAQRMNEPDHPWAPGLAERAVDSLLRGMTSPAPRLRAEATR